MKETITKSSTVYISLDPIIFEPKEDETMTILNKNLEKYTGAWETLAK